MEWTDDDVRKEIREALKIAREDGIIKRLGQLEEKLTSLITPSSDDKDTEGKPPPAKDPKPSNEKPRKSLWWGETE